MRSREKNHVTELLFSIALLCVFLIAGVLVIMTGAGVYQRALQNSGQNYNMQTSVSYIIEKIRQGDRDGGISLGEISDGIPALMISSQYQDSSYTTYIYVCDGEMRELFVRDGVSADASDGTTLLEAASLELEEMDDGLLRITISDAEGNTSSVLIHPSSEPSDDPPAETASQTAPGTPSGDEEGGGL